MNHAKDLINKNDYYGCARMHLKMEEILESEGIDYE